MTATVAELASAAVVPDSIEPLEQWRTWMFDGSALVSHNGERWTPSEAHKAKCMGVLAALKWSLVPHGWSCERAAKHVADSRELVAATQHTNRYFYYQGPFVPDAPQTVPPQGYGYALETVTHDAPNGNCSCGIYAGATPDDCPSGDVLGKVKLWGTLIPGEKGSRAEFAYPSELHVPARLANDPALLAYGVPIVTIPDSTPAISRTPERYRMHWSLKLAIALNLAACAFNLAAGFHLL